MSRFADHRVLFGSIALLFIGLTYVVAIMPALDNQARTVLLPTAAIMTPLERAGEQVFIAEGCVACHTQQVREVAMDRPWGERPGIPADYAQATRQDLWRNTATLMGTERTGPDLTTIGTRQPSEAWHLLHLYAPRAVVPASIMPSYPWLFTVKPNADEHDVVVNVPPLHQRLRGVVVATPRALELVAYLRSRKQATLPNGIAAPPYRLEARAATMPSQASEQLNGKELYTTNCASCHQADGKGLPGAFPPLDGSATVNGDDIEQYVNIIMRGVDRLPDYAVMPGVGELNALTPEQVTAIINHERTSWGNRSPKVSVERVKAALKQVPPLP